MEKDAFLRHWAAIRRNQKVQPKPVRYGHEGSTYAQDGIRITGSRVFIDSVISRLKDLLVHENDETRLQVVYQRSAGRENGRQLTSWNCYIQVHQRGAVKKEQKSKEKKK